MHRREFLAGIGSVSVLATSAVIALRGPPSIGNDGKDPVTIETLDAPGSESGEMKLPAPDRPTFIDFFATWCPPCESQMPALAEANERIGNDVLFVSVTSEGLNDGEIAEWWETHGGNWWIGRDRRTELTARYSPSGYPHAVSIDAAGETQWSASGEKTVDELVGGIQQALGGNE